MASNEDTLEEIPYEEKEHSSKLLQQFHEFRKTERYCDFKILVGNKVFPVHQNVLGANSEYFRAMLEHDNLEKSSKEVKLEFLDERCVAVCIDFMYGQRLFIPKSRWEDLMNAATRLQVNDLCTLIIQYLEEKLDADSFYTIKNIADTYNIDKLSCKCLDFVAKNFMSVIKSNDFVKFEWDFIHSLLTKKEIKITEKKKLPALMRWVKHDIQTREKFFYPMLEKLDLSQVSVGHRKYLLNNDPLISKSFQCFKLISLSIMEDVGIPEKEDILVDNGDNESMFVLDGNSRMLQQYFPENKSWKQVHSIPSECNRNNCTLIAFKESVYIFMHNKTVYGIDFENETKTVLWHRKQDMPHAHGKWPCLVADEQYIFAVEGSATNSYIDMYDPAMDQWTALASGHGREHFASVINDGKIWCIGGHLNCTLTESVKHFDLSSHLWYDVQQLPSARHFSASAVLDDSIYVLGGFSKTKELNETLVYSIFSKAWSVLKPMVSGRHCFNALTMCNHIYAVGGYLCRDAIERYSIKEKTWEKVVVPDKGMEIFWSAKSICDFIQ